MGGDDQEVLALNRRAREAMVAPCDLEVVPGATHLFEAAALDTVAAIAARWFIRHSAVGAAPVADDGQPARR